MPTMVRPEGKPKKIAYEILGVPVNIKEDKVDLNRNVREKLLFEETQLVR